MTPKLNLVVIRAQDPDRLAGFYQTLGLQFQKRHGEGPEHFAAEMDGSVFEIYPQAAKPATTSVRLGFQVTHLASLFDALINQGATFVKKPSPSPWGERAILRDPEGHTVELMQSTAG